jgi:hypothetical protein
MGSTIPAALLKKRLHVIASSFLGSFIASLSIIVRVANQSAEISG